MRRTTIREVAIRAGVSHQTVSRVINNSPYVSETTRTQVLQAIADLDYHPNANAVGLSRNRSDIIGLVVESVTSPFFTQIIDGVARGLHDRGRFLLLAATREATQIEMMVSLQRSRRIDGMIVVLPVEPSLEHAYLLSQDQLPVILIDLHYELDTNYIAVDNFQGAYNATEHLITLGHRRIGIICGRSDVPVGAIRRDGYRAALQHYGIPFDSSLVVPGDFKALAGHEGANALLDLDQPPTAIFASNDEMAVGAMHAIRQRGLGIPEHVSGIGFDDIPEAQISYPALTTIHQPLYEMGELAGSHICRLIEDPEQPRLQVTMSTRLIVRESTAPPPESSR
ncbi:MAG TPA: LacI family DNA-binding transcriptional regulator [Roseiflexaceae bacterium]|nr:LacI family DNA-binding transcriptional regulator [Roseiflexaceae bacterium]